MATASTEWPSPNFPAGVKDLINLFYHLIESQAGDVGRRLAIEVFTPTGVMKSGAQKFIGSEELKTSRATAWTHVASRKHVIKRVFAGSASHIGSDIMMLGRLDLGLRNGTSLSMEFVSRFVLENEITSKPKIALCEVWADSAPLMRAIAGIKEGEF